MAQQQSYYPYYNGMPDDYGQYQPTDPGNPNKKKTGQSGEQQAVNAALAGQDTPYAGSDGGDSGQAGQTGPQTGAGSLATGQIPPASQPMPTFRNYPGMPPGYPPGVNYMGGVDYPGTAGETPSYPVYPETPIASPDTTPSTDYSPPSFSWEPAQFNAPQRPGAGSFNLKELQLPDFGPEQAQLRALLQQILSNPTGLDPLTIAQMKERSKSQSVGMQRQLQDQLRQTAAQRGTLGGGQTAAAERRLGETLAGDVLKGNRDVDIYAAEKAMSDKVGNLGAATSAFGNLNNTALQRALAQADTQRQLDELIQSSYNTDYGNTLDLYKFNENMALQQQMLAEQAYQAWLQAIQNGTA